MNEIPDFYNEQAENIQNAETIREMSSKYQRFLDDFLEKSYKEGDSRGLLELVKANGDNIDFKIFLEYLLDNPEKFKNDDIYQLAELRNATTNLKEETETLGPRDFQIVGGRMGSYEFIGNDNIKYLGRNFYEVDIDFSKIRNHEVTSWLNIRSQYDRGDKFYIHYDGNNVIKYYSGNSLERRRLLGHEVINHKNETVVEGNTIYNRGAEQDVYLRDLGMHLRVKFFQKRER